MGCPGSGLCTRGSGMVAFLAIGCLRHKFQSERMSLSDISMRRACGILGLVLTPVAWLLLGTGSPQSGSGDQVTRRFDILEDGHETGTESWLGKTNLDSVVEFRGETRMTKPEPKVCRFRYRVGADGQPRQLSVRVDSGRESVRGEYLFGEKKVEGRVTLGLRAPQTWDLLPSAGYHVDFGPVLFSMVAIERLRLKQGESRSLNVVLIDRSSLVPKLVTQMYTYRGNEMIELHGQQHDANRYIFYSGSGARRVGGDLWPGEE